MSLTTHPPRRGSPLTATPTLVRFLLRVDRIRALVWVLGIGAMGFYFAHAVQVVAGDDAALAELAGVLIVGTLTFLDPSLFPDATVWSHYGQGYGFVPLLLPLVALFYLRRGGQRDVGTGPSA